MSDELTGHNAFVVRTTDDENKVGLGIYNFPDGVDPNSREAVANFLAGVRLEPEQAYEIAQLITRCAMKVEDARKARGQ